MKKECYPLVFLALALVLGSCGDKPAEQKSLQTQKVTQSKSVEKIKPACNLTMGWDPWEPYQYLTPDNQVKGLDIDLISAIAAEADCNIKFVQNDWMNLLKGIREGSIDLLGGASKTASREEFAYFSPSYRHESFVLYVKAEKVADYSGKSLAQLMSEKFRLGVTEDYLYGDEVSNMQDNQTLTDQIVTVPITEVNYYNLTQNQIDGFLEDPFVAGYTIKRKGLSKQISAFPIEVHSGDVSILFSKSSVNQETVAAFNKGLEAINASGEYERILKKYSH